MAPGSTAPNHQLWVVSVTTSNDTTGVANDYWPVTSSGGRFNTSYQDTIWPDEQPRPTRAQKLWQWTRAALLEATVTARQRPARAPLLAPRHAPARRRCAAAHGRWRAGGARA